LDKLRTALSFSGEDENYTDHDKGDLLFMRASFCF